MTASTALAIPPGPVLKILCLPAGNGLKCSQCLKRGHECQASRLIDGDPFCIWCLDELPCAFTRKKPIAPIAKPVIAPKKVASSIPVSSKKSQEFPKMQTETQKTNGHAAPSAAASLRICKCGCGNAVPAANRFAYLAGHLRRAGMPVKNKAKTSRACSVIGCDRVLRSDNKSGICTPHSQNKKGPKLSAPRISQLAAESIAAGNATSPRVALQVNERQLDRFLTKLSFEEKQHLANYYLQGVDSI